MSRWQSRIGLICAVLLLFGCSVQRSPITGQKRAYAYSWEEEIRIGREADQQIQGQYGIYDHPRLEEYVNEVGRKVLEVSHMRREEADPKYRETDFHFRILDSPVVNAFALPGGYVYVTRGLMAHLQNEAQLAVVLGHEIGHVAARHASQRALEQQLGQIALLGGAIAGQELLGVPGGNILDLGSQAARFLFLKYGREDERESDGLGVEYAARAGYRASEGAEFFVSLKRISEQSGEALPNFLSTHPDPASRAESIPELAGEWAEKGYEQTTTNHRSYMEGLENMVYGSNPREGFTRNGTYYHPELAFRFDFPGEWSLVNQRSRVVLVSPPEDALSILQIDSENATPEASAAAFLEQEGIKVITRESGSQHGLETYHAEASATKNGTVYRFSLTALAYGEEIYRFISYSREEQYPEYRSRFREIAGSFRELEDSEILSIQPLRLNVAPVRRTAPLSELLPEPLPENTSVEDIAILNQVEQNQPMEEGRLLKVPVQE